MHVRINVDRTVKGIHTIIPAGVMPRSMGKEFFWDRNPLEANPFNAP